MNYDDKKNKYFTCFFFNSNVQRIWLHPICGLCCPEHLTSPYLWFVLSRTSDFTLSVVCVQFLLFCVVLCGSFFVLILSVLYRLVILITLILSRLNIYFIAKYYNNWIGHKLYCLSFIACDSNYPYIVCPL